MTIERYRGDTKRIVYTVKDVDGIPIDVTGWSFLFTVNTERNPTDSTSQVAQIPATIDDAVNGRIHFPFSGVTIGAGSYHYDIQATDGNGETETLEKSVLEIRQDITK